MKRGRTFHLSVNSSIETTPTCRQVKLTTVSCYQNTDDFVSQKAHLTSRQTTQIHNFIKKQIHQTYQSSSNVKDKSLVREA